MDKLEIRYRVRTAASYDLVIYVLLTSDHGSSKVEDVSVVPPPLYVV